MLDKHVCNFSSYYAMSTAWLLRHFPPIMHAQGDNTRVLVEALVEGEDEPPDGAFFNWPDEAEALLQNQ